MFERFKALGVAAAIAVMPVAASAVTFSAYVDIGGEVDWGTSDFTAGSGWVDVDPVGTVEVPVSSGIFSAMGIGDTVTMYDLDLSADPGGLVWEWTDGTDTISFYAETAFSVTSSTSSLGTVSYEFAAEGYAEDMAGAQQYAVFSLTTQRPASGSTGKSYSYSSTTAAVPVPAAGLLLLSGLGGIAIARRRKS